ncbi:MAG: hypothetical protein SCH71_14105 [Desulfobulbaceae bacterium]|nr:hypothetical protein [Desulfobulbaceae bacterium]
MNPTGHDHRRSPVHTGTGRLHLPVQCFCRPKKVAALSNDDKPGCAVGALRSFQGFFFPGPTEKTLHFNKLGKWKKVSCGREKPGTGESSAAFGIINENSSTRMIDTAISAYGEFAFAIANYSSDTKAMDYCLPAQYPFVKPDPFFRKKKWRQLMLADVG